MKLIILLLGLVVVFLGLFPLIVEFVPETLKNIIPAEGMAYNLLITLVGALIVYLSFEGKKNVKTELMKLIKK